MRRVLLVVVLLVVLVLAGGYGAVTVARKLTIRDALRDAFQRRGLPPEWGEALGLTETNLNPSATNHTGRDEEMGGSYGATQITATLLRLTGGPTPEELLADPMLQAETTAQLVEQGAAVHFVHGVPTLATFGRPSSPEQMASVWNAGKLPDDPNLSADTRDTYIPRLLEHLSELT